MTEESKTTLRVFGGLFCFIAFAVATAAIWAGAGTVAAKLGLQAGLFAVYGAGMLIRADQ